MGSERIPHGEMAEDLKRMADAKAGWLETFSHGAKKRPDGEIETQQQHLRILEQAESDYRRAAERQQ